jgi:hypothetical protein
MAVYKIFPSADATLYSDSGSQNTGLDEIIEFSTFNSTPGFAYTPQVSRALIQFATSDLNTVWGLVGASATSSVSLKLFAANVTGLSKDTTIEVHPISQSSWNMGTGKRFDEPIVTNGVSWIWSDYSGSNAWAVTGSTYYAGSGSTSLTVGYYNNPDLTFDVTTITRNWSSSAYPNYGFIVKQTGSDEFNTNPNTETTLRYYSRDTHTIYPPQLEFKWRDFTFNTGSLTQLNILPATVALNDNPGIFFSESVNRFRVDSRPTYPPQVWTTSSVYTINYYLPTASYWAIKDLDTNEFVVDFDTTYTQLSVDASGSYFDLYMNGLEPERYYKILIQSTINGSTIVYDNNYYFKVVNG